MKKEFKLCFVEKPWAWFTTADLKDQWGDDWNDSPYECNAGWPYEWYDGRQSEKYELMKLAFDDNGDLRDPSDGHCNSPYSVEDINNGATAWLFSQSWAKESVCIPAGISVDEFIEKMEKIGGKIYFPMERVAEK